MRISSKWASKLRQRFPGLHSLIEKKLEDVDLDFFSQLGLGDILFIDSSHTIKIGGDVNYLFLEVLPRLKRTGPRHFSSV
jgi:hypothetical protein